MEVRRRVGATEAFVEEILRYVSRHGDEIIELTRRLDREAVSRGLDASRVPMGIEFKPDALPGPVEILVGEVVTKENPRTRREMTAMVESAFVPVPMLDYGLFAAARTSALPYAYVMTPEPEILTAIDRIRAHGIAVEELTEALSLPVERYVIESIDRAPREFQGHQEIKLSGRAESGMVAFPAGSFLVRTAQPLQRLVFYLLEPESDDGLVNWNLFDAYLRSGATYPVYKLYEAMRIAGRLYP